MSSPGGDTPKDKSPRKILDIDLHNSPVMQEARLAAEAREKLIQEMEKHSGVRALREPDDLDRLRYDPLRASPPAWDDDPLDDSRYGATRVELVRLFGQR